MLDGHIAQSDGALNPTNAPIHRQWPPRRTCKTWTPQEDYLLLRARLEGFPYSLISRDLGRSDYACRMRHGYMLRMARDEPDEYVPEAGKELGRSDRAYAKACAEAGGFMRLRFEYERHAQ